MHTPALSTDQIKTFFEENGFYLAKAVFTTAQIEALEEDFDGIVRQMVAS